MGIFYFGLLLFLIFCSSSSKAQALIDVKQAKFNFGFVKKGSVVKVEYELSNTGKEPLILSKSEVACSCTTVDFSEQPILPGQKTRVSVSFDTKTVYGRQDRVVLLYSNAKNGPTKLRFKGIVSSKP